GLAPGHRAASVGRRRHVLAGRARPAAGGVRRGLGGDPRAAGPEDDPGGRSVPGRGVSARPHPGRELWVLFARPPVPLPDGAAALSFLRPFEEEELAAHLGPGLLRGRLVVDDVRDEARRTYVEVTARLAATPVLPGGRSLRKALGGRGASRW